MARPLRRAIGLMQDHVEPTLSIEALAARLGLSTRRLERLFGRTFGMPPKRYYDLIRLHRAREAARRDRSAGHRGGASMWLSLADPVFRLLPETVRTLSAPAEAGGAS